MSLFALVWACIISWAIAERIVNSKPKPKPRRGPNAPPGIVKGLWDFVLFPVGLLATIAQLIS